MNERHKYFLEHHFHFKWRPSPNSQEIPLKKALHLGNPNDYLKGLHLLAIYGYLFIIKSGVFEPQIDLFTLGTADCLPYLSYYGQEASFDAKKMVNFLNLILHESELSNELFQGVWETWIEDLQQVMDHIRTDHSHLIPQVNALLEHLVHVHPFLEKLH